MNDRLKLPLNELLTVGEAGTKQDTQYGPSFEPFAWISSKAMASASETRMRPLNTP